MNNECSIELCPKCALRFWCDHRIDQNYQALIRRVDGVQDPNFKVTGGGNT